MGFYTTRFVQAKNVADAELKALEVIKDDNYLNDDPIRERSPNARVFFDEIDELIGEPDNKDVAGFTFYNKENEK